MNTKQTEIGEIPEDWEVVKLGEVAPLQRGFDLPERQRVDGAYPVVYSNGILNTHNAYKVKAPGVVTGRSGTLGRVHYLEEDFWAHNTTLWVTDFINVEPKFIAYLFQFIGLERFGGGSGVPTLNRNDVHDFQVALPQSKPEQAAIAAVLSDTDRLFAALRALIGKKRAVKTAAMQQLLSGSLRLPEFATNGNLKNSELGEIPEDWEVVKLGEIANIQRGASPRPIDSPIWFDQNSSIGWLRISDVSNADKYLYETSQNLSELGVANSRLIEQDNLVMSICATVGKPIITKKDLCIHDGFVVFGSLHCDMEFMYYILQSIEPIWAKSGQTGSQMNLNTDLIKSTQVALPQSKPEQTAIAQTLSDMDSEITALEARAAKLAQIKQGLMQNLLTGKIRVNTGAA